MIRSSRIFAISTNHETHEIHEKNLKINSVIWIFLDSNFNHRALNFKNFFFSINNFRVFRVFRGLVLCPF
jgi:hypothetical protein